MSGKKGKSGRRKKQITELADWVEANKGKVTDLLEALYTRGLEMQSVKCPKCQNSFEIKSCGDRESAIYVIDRILGRPHQSQDLRIKAGVLTFTPDDYELMTRPGLAEQELIEEHTDAV